MNNNFKKLCNLHLTNMLNRLGDDVIIKIPIIDETNKTITYEDLQIKCLFENPYYLIQNDYDSNVGIETSKPKIVCKSEDVKNVKINYKVIVDEVNYKIIDIQPDGTGIVNLLLQRI